MAHENIKIQNPNFCRGPQLGTICTIDTSNPSTVLRIKDTGGNTIIDLSLSSNILTEDVRVEYVGPPNLNAVVDDLTFFTFEKVTDTRCMIKRWETRMAYRELLLKEQIVKNSSGSVSYAAIDFAVEYYNRALTRAIQNDNHLYLNSVENIKTGTKLFLGPSTDSTNPGATEVLTVSHISEGFGDYQIYTTGTAQYEYAHGDFVSFYSNVYVFSNEVVPGDDRQGSIIRHDAYTWAVVSQDSKAWYKRVTATRWCPQVRGIASIMRTNMIFVRPYDSYQNWRSLFLNNVKSDKNTVFDVYDVVFDGSIIYKLQKFITLKDDEGKLDTHIWDNDYNYQEDTLSPYSNNINVRLLESIATGYYKTMTLHAQVRDQFHVGLRDVTVDFAIDEDFDYDDDGFIWPYSGLATTDINGEATIEYITGSDYYGHTWFVARGTGSTNATGNEFVWAREGAVVISYPDYPEDTYRITQKSFLPYYTWGRQLPDPFMRYGISRNDPSLSPKAGWVPIETFMDCKNFFTSPGGTWGNDDVGPGRFEPPKKVEEYLPMLYTGTSHTDGPALLSEGFGFDNWPYTTAGVDDPYYIGNQIKLFTALNSDLAVEAYDEFRIHHGKAPRDPNDPSKPISKQEGWPPYKYVVQPDETDRVQLSQLKLSLHTHWLDGVAYDELTGYVNIDQFIFVEDAIPKFWSEKNPVETDVWIRLRPFAFSLDKTTLRMWLKVVSYTNSTDWYEITDSLVLDNFDAGGNILGVEAYYNPPEDFPYGALVQVYIEVYDEAYIPNFVMVNYWWYTTPDYKAPYLTNLSPSSEEENVPVDTNIHFEIKDRGTGIDLDSMEFLINSRIMTPEDVTITVVNEKHVVVDYKPSRELQYSNDYKIAVKCQDSSLQENKMNDSYIFYTADSTGLYITDPVPRPCKRGMMRFEDVSVVVLADGNGIDQRTIRMQVYNKDVHPRIVPIVYRIG